VSEACHIVSGYECLIHECFGNYRDTPKYLRNKVSSRGLDFGSEPKNY
jgi:hypothetical protein